MEITKPSFQEKLRGLFLKEKIPFAYKADVNWKTVRKCLFVSVAFAVVVLLGLPAPKIDSPFHEKLTTESSPSPIQVAGPDLTEETIRQLNEGPPRSAPANPTSEATGGSGGDHSASMILTRGGLGSKTQIPSGSRISVRLTEAATLATASMPVIGIVTRDFIHEDIIAVPEGSKLFGQASFNGDADRAQIDWRSIQLPDGRERPLSAIGVSADGQAGVEGMIHSNGIKNSVGATLTRFIGAYAQGSMQTGALGTGPGGSENGWKNAIAETARERGDEFAEDLKKEKRWIELSPAQDFHAILTSNFSFRDPGLHE